MMFFFKRKEIVLECFTNRPELILDAPIDRAHKYMPEWWKSLPKPCLKSGEMVAEVNMRHCPGIVELYKHSIVIPMWSDLKLDIGGNTTEPYGCRWQFADRQSGMAIHNPSERGVYLPDKHYQHLKLDTPWCLKTNKLVKWAWFGATWNAESPESVIVPPAIDEYYHQHSSSINLFVPRTEQRRELLIPFRQPLVFLTPLTEHNLKLKHTLVSDEELRKIDTSGGYTPKFFNSYYYKRKVRSK
jgi:hypothetical protein